MKVGLGMKFDVFWARGGGGGILPYMSYIGMYRCEGYGFQAVYSRIGYIKRVPGSQRHISTQKFLKYPPRAFGPSVLSVIAERCSSGEVQLY